MTSQFELAGARVIFVLGPLELGGSERQALLFARYLKDEERAQVQIWGTMGIPGRLAELCNEYEIPWRIVPTPWLGGRLERLRRLIDFSSRLRRAGAQIVLPYMEMPNQVCGAAWRWAGARVCVWNQRDDGIARQTSIYERCAIRLTRHFIANSGQGAKHLIERRGVPPEHIRVVHNGIEIMRPKMSRADWRNRRAIPEPAFVATMLANLTQYKDHATLLRAWRVVVDSLNQSGRHAVLLLAGRPDETYLMIEALAHELNLVPHLQFLGEVEDVSGLLAACEVGILCSNSEGSPNSVLEYMAAGLAVAGTDLPAMRELLTTENHALLAPAKDPEALAGKILRLAEDAEMRRRIGDNNRRRATSEFTARRMCEQTVSVIRNALTTSARARIDEEHYETRARMA